MAVAVARTTFGGWRPATLPSVHRVRARGISSPASFEHDFDYLDAMAGALHARDARAVSCRYPVAYDVLEEAARPPFLLDIMPAGAARRHWDGVLEPPNDMASGLVRARTGGRESSGQRARV